MGTSFSQGRGVLWAISLGILTAFTAGATINVTSTRQESLITVALFLVAATVLYVYIRRTWGRWAREQPLVRIVVYFLPLFFGLVVVDGFVDATVTTVFGWRGIVLSIVDTVVSGLVFAGTVWLAFLGGMYRIRDALIDRFDVTW